MAVTPVGNPYVESSDLVANYPGASEALAERIDIVGVNPFANAAARDAAIPSPVQGQMCSLNDDNKGYRYDGSAWVLFSGAGDANFTNVATGTYTDGDSVDWKYKTFTGAGSLVIDVAGECLLLVLGGGGGGDFGSHGGLGGYTSRGTYKITAATHTVTVGGGGPVGVSAAAARGSDSSVGSSFLGYGGGVGSNTLGESAFNDDITGTSVSYAGANTVPIINRGQGGRSNPQLAGSSGIVIIAVKV